MDREIRILEGNVHGIDLKFIDLKTSGTVGCVFTELQRNDYGFEEITLNEDDVLIDVGANVGMVSIYVKKKFNCKVIAFEPVTINLKHFKENILLNGLKLNDFEIHNTAITSVEGDTITIGTPDYNTGGSSIFHTCSDINSICKTETLNKYIGKECSYLKIDVEGAEYEIIPSIINDLNKCKHIAVEAHRFFHSQNPDELKKLIKANYNGKLFFVV